MTQRIRELLQARGIDTAPPATCQVTEADVETGRDGVLLTLRLEDGQTVERRVATARAAATVIESWLGGDVALEPPDDARTSRVDRHTTAATTAPRHPTPAPKAAPAPPPPRAAASVRGAATAGIDAAGATWAVLQLGVCVMFDPLCIGMSMRGLLDTKQSGPSARLHSARAGIDLLATVGWPVELGRLTLTPLLGLGAGWLRSSYDADTPTEDRIDVDLGGIRTTGGLLLGLPGRRLNLEFGLFADASPTAAPKSFTEDGQRIAGQPKLTVRLGVGARWRP